MNTYSGKVENMLSNGLVKPLDAKAVRWTAEYTGILIARRIARNKMFTMKSLTNSGWQAILSDLKESGASKSLTIVQVKKKWSNLYAKYKDIKENKKYEEIQWPYFERMNNFFNEESSLKSTNAMLEVKLLNCRLCQKMEGIHSLVKDSDLCVQIDECTSLKVLDNLAYFPCKVCDTCKILINKFHIFLINCRLIDQKLREAINIEAKFSTSFNCIECPMLNTDESLGKRMNNHKKASNFQCEICFKRFSRKSTLCIHSKIHEVECEKKESKDVLKDKIPDIDTDYKQEEEDNEDINNDELIAESFEKTENKLINCELCPKTFFRQCDLRIHLDTHTGVTHTCPRQDCNKTYSTLSSLRNHERKHLGLNSFLCVSCGKGFVTKNALKCHEKIHQEVKEYICNICSCGFSVMGNLKTHQRKHHEGHRFYCSQCPRVFLAKCSLQRHELIHTGVKEFSCDTCSSAFYTSKELVKHKRYHQGVRSYHCNQCFKTFFEKHHLTVHLRCHTGERPYICKLPGCAKSFRESQKLTRHMKTHRPVRN